MTTDEPPWDEAGNPFTVTFKGGKGYEEPWLVIRAGSADSLRQRVAFAAGIDPEGLSLFEVINNASVQFHALSSLGSKLGAQVMTQSQTPSTAGRADPWASAEETAKPAAPAAPADPNAALLAEIEAAKTVDELRRFWVEHNPLNDVVQAAWSAKGKSLKEGNS